MGEATTDTTDTTRVEVIERSTARAGPAGTACLVTIYGPDLGRKIELDGRPMTLGRDPDCDLPVGLEGISRKHCRISGVDGIYLVRDLGSTNGTQLNDRELTPNQDFELHSGDHVHVPGAVFKYLDGGNVAALYHEEIYRMTIVDGLTGAFNRRYLLDFLGREMSRCRRHHRPLSLVMFDVDHFKAINDEFGFITGDQVLRELASLVSQGVRREECLARYSGDGFVVVLPETPRGGARIFAERLRGLVEYHAFPSDRGPLDVTVSLGVAELAPHMSEPSQFLHAADAGLYAAKDAGWNLTSG